MEIGGQRANKENGTKGGHWEKRDLVKKTD